MKKILLGHIAGALLAMAGQAQAAGPDIKPGLWEMQIQQAKGMNMPDMAEMQKAMKQMQAQMAQLPPEQRKMMEQHMGNSGVAFSDKGMRICMTADDIKRESIPLSDDNCKNTIKTRTAKRWVMSTVCTQPQMTGEAEALFESPTAYSVNMKGTMTEKGKTRPYDMSMRWKFVSADCGKVKPHSALRQPAR